jgi:hypothetical protein
MGISWKKEQDEAQNGRDQGDESSRVEFIRFRLGHDGGYVMKQRIIDGDDERKLPEEGIGVNSFSLSKGPDCCKINGLNTKVVPGVEVLRGDNVKSMKG